MFKRPSRLRWYSGFPFVSFTWIYCLTFDTISSLSLPRVKLFLVVPFSGHLCLLFSQLPYTVHTRPVLYITLYHFDLKTSIIPLLCRIDWTISLSVRSLRHA